MGLKANVLCPAALYLILAVVTLVRAQTCTVINNNSYDNNGNLVTLYQIPSASACCSACNAFVDSVSWTYCQDSTNSAYQTCVCKSGLSTTLTSSNSFTSGTNGRSVYHPAGVSCGTIVPGTDINQNNVATAPASNSQGCCAPCLNTTGCSYWAWYQGVCYMKAVNSTTQLANSQVNAGSLSLPVGSPRPGLRGLGIFNSATCTDILSLTNLGWIYNWAPSPPASIVQCLLASGIEYVPMIWGLPLNLNSIWVSPNTKHLLTFNEPNFASQSNISPAAAANAWPQIQQFANQNNLLIGSPAVAAGGNPAPVPWLDQFFGNCSGCQVDFITTHIYDCNANWTAQEWMQTFKKYGKPVWLTEFDCPNSGSVTEATEFVAELTQLLDADPILHRYAYFGFRVAPGDQNVGVENSIFNYSSNAFTQIGKIYNTPQPSTTTAAPSTQAPTTLAPTTVAPTTRAATTVAPTTLAPTTLAPTTRAATTVAPTTLAPTTVAPTTRASTTAAVTTAAPATTAAPSSSGITPGTVIIGSVSNGRYVVVDPNSRILNATAANSASATVFNITAASIGNYNIWSSTYNSFVSADNYGANPLIDNRGSASTWENFNFTKQANGYYTITSYISREFVGVLPSSGLLANVAVTSSPPNNALFVITPVA